jgi:ATP-dependent DNA helicase RecG
VNGVAYLLKPITSLSGIGPAGAKLCARLVARGLNVLAPDQEPAAPLIRDLLFHLPVDVLERQQSPSVREAEANQRLVLRVKVEGHYPPPPGKGKRQPYKVICGDATGELILVFFHAKPEFIRRQLPEGSEVAVAGRMEIYNGVRQMAHPDAIVPASRLPELLAPQPVYPLTAELTQGRLQRWVSTALHDMPDVPEWMSDQVRQAQGWMGLKPALQALHTPKDRTELAPDAPPRARLAYDEALASQLALLLVRRFEGQYPGIRLATGGPLYQRMIEALPFTLTAGQREVLSEIAADLCSGRTMLRLLQGDVGSGKTVVAMLSMLAAVDGGRQAALMVPTGILAQQHYRTLSRWCEAIGVRCVLLVGSQSAAERKRTLAAIAEGEAQIAIGTHALFQKGVVFHRLGLAVIDEQHRFGVMQRMALAGKGEAPHLLLMTATPIPRSLTLTLYGDLDSSALREKPAGRQPIVTRAVPVAREADVLARLHATLAEGARVYWICPLVGDEESPEETDFAAAVERHTHLQGQFPGRVGLVHGRMKLEEREAEMRRFAAGEYQILVATTVIEVGVDVPEATVIVIENAERFGLAQLHQLRGRVGRGDKPSSCVLLYGEALSEYGKERLKVIRDLDDGFAIAEEDLRLRGGGDMLGTRQSGLPDFRFIDLYKHGELIRQARRDIEHYLSKDPGLKEARGKALAGLLHVYGYDRLVNLLRSG